VIGAGAFFVATRAQIVARAAHYGIPTAHAARSAVAEGGLIYYGNDLTDAYHRNGIYVGRIWAAHGLKPHQIKTFKTVDRPEVCRQGAGCRRPLCRSARARAGAVG